MRILVTGGAGYIGSHAVRWLLGQGHEVWVIDNLSRGHAWAVPADRLHVTDLADVPAVAAILRDRQIDSVMHFAALAQVGESVQEPEMYYLGNLTVTLGLLRAMRSVGVRRLVFSSTCATYGNPRFTPLTEDHPQEPINPYGRTKLAIEWALADYAAAYGLAYAALRYFNAAGAAPGGGLGEAHSPETHLIPLVLETALGQRDSVRIFGDDYPTPDGTCIRDYLHVDDLAEAHALALTQMQPGRGLCLNLGTGRGHSVREIIAACERVTGRAIPVEIGPRRLGDPPVLVASTAAAAQALGWRARYTEIDEIIRTAWEWHRQRSAGG
ncbi:MAG TPA: UDP-glucose 4-epimerase GalE [Gemmatales bacterium]|nr:UDP-glucose 4-epimerase GalE [Gemmatales bacterium]